MVSDRKLQSETDKVSDSKDSDSGLIYVSEAPADIVDSQPDIDTHTSPKVANLNKSQPPILSAMQKGLDEMEFNGEQHGLFKYFGKGSKETFKAHVDCETEQSQMYLEDEAHQLQAAQRSKEDITQERARLCKAKSRQIAQEAEICSGVCTLAG